MEHKAMIHALHTPQQPATPEEPPEDADAIRRRVAAQQQARR
jgi:hypothetical protein